MREKIKKEVIELATKKYPDPVAIDAGAIVISEANKKKDNSSSILFLAQ